MADESKDGNKPAYVPFATLQGFVGKLKETAIPSRIDNSVMSNLSGSAQSQLLTALRFLGLTASNGAVNQSLRALVSAHGNEKEWRDALGDYLLPAYIPVIGDLDVGNATSAELDEKFRQAGATGSVLEKATRFYLKLMDEAGLSYSPHFKSTRASSGNSSPRKKKAKARAKPPTQDVQNPRDEKLATGMIAFPIHFPSKTQGQITVPRDLNAVDLAMVKATLVAIEAYADQQTNGGDA